MRPTSFITTGVLLAVCLPGLAQAGRGSSPGAIQRAITSNSVDAIASELERAEHLVCPSCVPLVRPLIDHPDVRVRGVAAWWLGRRGLQGDLLQAMSARLQSGGTNPDVDSVKARNAADVLGGLRSRGAIAPLSAALTEGRFSGEARAAMVRALGAIGDPAATATLGLALRASEAPVRAAAAEAMRALRGFEDPGLAVALLDDTSEDVRTQAIYTIGATRTKALASGDTAARRLADLVIRDPSAAVRKKAAWALGEIGAPSAVAAGPLGQASRQDADPLVRSLASAALAKLSR